MEIIIQCLSFCVIVGLLCFLHNMLKRHKNEMDDIGRMWKTWHRRMAELSPEEASSWLSVCARSNDWSCVIPMLPPPKKSVS